MGLLLTRRPARKFYFKTFKSFILNRPIYAITTKHNDIHLLPDEPTQLLSGLKLFGFPSPLAIFSIILSQIVGLHKPDFFFGTRIGMQRGKIRKLTKKTSSKFPIHSPRNPTEYDNKHDENFAQAFRIIELFREKAVGEHFEKFYRRSLYSNYANFFLFFS